MCRQFQAGPGRRAVADTRPLYPEEGSPGSHILEGRHSRLVPEEVGRLHSS